MDDERYIVYRDIFPKHVAVPWDAVLMYVNATLNDPTVFVIVLVMEDRLLICQNGEGGVLLLLLLLWQGESLKSGQDTSVKTWMSMSHTLHLLIHSAGIMIRRMSLSLVSRVGHPIDLILTHVKHAWRISSQSILAMHYTYLKGCIMRHPPNLLEQFLVIE